MRVWIAIFMLVVMATGCQKKEAPQETATGIPQERIEVAKKLILKSLVDLQNKDLKSAVESLETSIKINPTSADAYLLLGQILLKVEEYDRAIQFLDDAAKIFPNNGTIFYMLSVSNRMSGKKLPAVLSARRAVELFQQEEDKDNMLKSALLLQELINTPDDKFVPANAAEVKKAK